MDARNIRNIVLMQPVNSMIEFKQIIEAYADFCPEMVWNALPNTEIQRELPSLMLEKFRTVRAQDIQREGKSKRGFRNVAFIGESEI